MADAMAACGPSRVSTSSSTAQASANGAFLVNGCVLIFNGQSSTAEILLFTRVNVASPPDNNITCGSPSSNTQGNTSILLKGDLKAAGTVPGTGAADFQDPNNLLRSGPEGLRSWTSTTSPPRRTCR